MPSDTYLICLGARALGYSSITGGQGTVADLPGGPKDAAWLLVGPRGGVSVYIPGRPDQRWRRCTARERWELKRRGEHVYYTGPLPKSLQGYYVPVDTPCQRRGRSS